MMKMRRTNKSSNIIISTTRNARATLWLATTAATTTTAVRQLHCHCNYGFLGLPVWMIVRRQKMWTSIHPLPCPRTRPRLGFPFSKRHETVERTKRFCPPNFRETAIAVMEKRIRPCSQVAERRWQALGVATTRNETVKTRTTIPVFPA